MNILIKLTCLIGLVIAPILGNGEDSKPKNFKHTMEMKSSLPENSMFMNPDTEFDKMTKDECADMCDEFGCSPEDKALCMSQYDKNGKFIGKPGRLHSPKEAKISEKEVRIEVTNNNGKVKAKVITIENGNTSIKTFEGNEEEVNKQLKALK